MNMTSNRIKNYFYCIKQLKETSFHSTIINYIDNSIDEQNHRTNAKCKMTSWYCMNLPGFNELAKHILNFAKTVSNNMYEINYNYYITEMWGMCYTSNQGALMHDHWPFVWSCAYYIDPPQNCPELIFPEINYSVKPKDGMLVLFPGWVMHGVPSKNFIGKRYVVSANLMPHVKAAVVQW